MMAIMTERKVERVLAVGGGGRGAAGKLKSIGWCMCDVTSFENKFTVFF